MEWASGEEDWVEGWGLAFFLAFLDMDLTKNIDFSGFYEEMLIFDLKSDERKIGDLLI